MQSYYTYRHRAGYGRDDHMADEIIARAARRLGGDTAGYIAQAVGLASHAVPMDSLRVSLPAAAGVRRRMERALRLASREVPRRDCRIDVVRVTVSRGRDHAEEEAAKETAMDQHLPGWVGCQCGCRAPRG